jgi:hypothetical protein
VLLLPAAAAAGILQCVRPSSGRLSFVETATLSLSDCQKEKKVFNHYSRSIGNLQQQQQTGGGGEKRLKSTVKI